VTLGLANPAGALALGAVGVLIVLHLYGRRRRAVPVGTLFLWQRVPAEPLDRRRFRPDLLFALQLVLLLALIAGLVRPYLEVATPVAERVRLLVVLDVSASMQAREEGGTRFELARRRARALVAQLLTGDEVMLVAAAERAHVVLAWTADHTRAQDRLEALEPLDTPTNLAAALELALGERRARPETQVAVLTDLPPGASGVARAELAYVDWIQIGRSDDNLAITGLSVDAPPFHPVGDATATVLVRNYAHVERRVVLEARVGTETWARRELVLAPRAAEPVLLTDPPADGELTVTLAVDDALAVDNRARAELPASRPLDVLVVSATRALGAALGASVTGSRVRTVEPARLAEAEPARVVVYDRSVPPGPPRAEPALYLAPPADNPICPGVRTADDAAVIDWDVDHPAVAGLQGLEALTLEHAVQLVTPGWGSAVVLGATARGAFPLLVAGERDGRRVACLGADLAGPLVSSDDVPFLLLLLSTLRWLEEPPGGAALLVETGVPVLAGPGAAEFHGPGLHVAGDPPVLLAERTGVYRVGARVVLANLFDDRESDIGREGGGEWPATARPAAADTAGTARRELGWWLYLAAAALLALEWSAWQRRRPREVA